MASNTKKEPIDWSSIEADFRSDSMSNRELARWYSISEGAIRKRAKAEGWVRIKCAPAKPVRQPTMQPLITATPVEPRDIVGRGRNLIFRLLDELDATTSHVGDIEDMIIDDTAKDRDERRQAAMLKAVSLPVRAGTIKSLATAFRTLTDATTPSGKKEQAEEASKTAGAGTIWGEDLGTPSSAIN